MTERQGDVRPATPSPTDEPPPGLVVHKSTRECTITQPHPAAVCGIVAARRRRTAAMSAAPETHRTGNEVRAITRDGAAGTEGSHG